MRIKHEGCVSSQQSPNKYFYYERKYKKSLYSHMFLEDFSGLFSTEFTSLEMRDGFYDVTPKDDFLKKLLLFSDYRYFHYHFDRLLSDVMSSLLLNGKAYVEIVSWMDSNNVIQGINLVPVPAKYHHKSRDKILFIAQSYNNETVHFSIDQKRLVIFDLKDIGFHRNYFCKLINHLAEFDEKNTLDLIQNPNMKGIFDYTEYQKLEDYKLLKMVNPIHWLGRNYSNQHLSESYLLYRKMQYKMLRYKFLDYILHQINEGLYRFKTEWGFSGKISASISLPDYKNLFIQYNNGKINASQLCSIVIENSTPKEES